MEINKISTTVNVHLAETDINNFVIADKMIEDISNDETADKVFEQFPFSLHTTSRIGTISLQVTLVKFVLFKAKGLVKEPAGLGPRN
jgi:hypothetical protein